METFLLITIMACWQIILGQILELPDESEGKTNNGFNSSPEESREGQIGKEVLEKSNKCDEK